MFYEPIFKDRHDAGRALAGRLEEYAGKPGVIVLALPRGGVPVAFEVASSLSAPLDVFLVRKLGVPGQEELAFGAIATGGATVFNEGVVSALRMPSDLMQAVIKREEAELARRDRLYRDALPPPQVRDKIVIVVDDGLATGATMAAAVKALGTSQPKEIVIAVPVASTQACDELDALEVVRCVCVSTPEPFYGVGMWYVDFSQTTDDEVQQLLTEARKNQKAEAKAHSGQQ